MPGRSKPFTPRNIYIRIPHTNNMIVTAGIYYRGKPCPYTIDADYTGKGQRKPFNRTQECKRRLKQLGFTVQIAQRNAILQS